MTVRIGGMSRAACEHADANDPLARFRARFQLPEGIIYLDGNSLGALPVGARERALEVIEAEWGRDLISSWNTNDWFALPERIGAKISRLIGGEGGACFATDTTSTNLFKVLSAALDLQTATPTRRLVISERTNFPTDLYVAEGLLGLVDRGYELVLVEDQDELFGALASRAEEVAVVMLTHVNYRTGRMWNMEQVTSAIHAAGALAIWDLCHSVGAVPLGLDFAGADFAVGCSYKYLNGGPGSPAFVWIAKQHLSRARQPLAGWWGHARPFDMAERYEQAADGKSFLAGTQPIISLATMEVGIDLALEAEIALVREKSLALSTLLIELVSARIPHHPLELVTPRDEAARGSHVSFIHPEGYPVMQALIAAGVIGDYREPGILRFGITPLYLGYADVWDAVEALRGVLDDETWRDARYAQRGAVT